MRNPKKPQSVQASKLPVHLFEIRMNDSLSSRHAYDNLYEYTSLSHFDSYYLWLFKILNPLPSARLLDISCGSGEFVSIALDAGLNALGIDFSTFVVRNSHNILREYNRVLVGDGEALPFPENYFDYITNIGSLEHFLSPTLGVQEMYRVLKPGGTAFVLVPNTFSLLVNVWNAFRKGITTVDNQPIQRLGARYDWANLLHNNGLHVYHTHKFERAWPQKWQDWAYYFRHPKELLRLLATPFVPLNLAFCFIFLCRKVV